MYKKTSFSTKGRRANIGDLVIHRILPNRYADVVGPFVFLDHVGPTFQLLSVNSGTGAHPHRGIATLTYVLEGEDEHFDSAGHHAMVRSGGIQWMKAGKGILHDETLNTDSRSKSNQVHAFQFWINLPAAHKEEDPEHLGIQAEDVPTYELPNGSGWVKVVTGVYLDRASSLPRYSNEFVYHIHLEGQGFFSHSLAQSVEVAAFLPGHDATINGIGFHGGEFIEFDRDAGEITIRNGMATGIDVLLFGGDAYKEAIVAEGPFVMNDHAGISQAYRDFYNGAYGTIT